jgi:hypothetical protein
MIYYDDQVYWKRVWVMVFNATFNHISVISWWSVLLVEETGVPRKNYKCTMRPQRSILVMQYIELYHIVYVSIFFLKDWLER